DRLIRGRLRQRRCCQQQRGEKCTDQHNRAPWTTCGPVLTHTNLLYKVLRLRTQEPNADAQAGFRARDRKAVRFFTSVSRERAARWDSRPAWCSAPAIAWPMMSAS